MNFTVTDIMDHGPCPEYTEEVVSDLWAGREDLTFREICSLGISARDRTWIAVRLVSRDTVVSWADYCADEAQKHAATRAYAATARAAAAATAFARAAAAAAYAAYAAYYAAGGAYYAASAAYWAGGDAAAGGAGGAKWIKVRNEELERLLSKLIEMHEAE